MIDAEPEKPPVKLTPTEKLAFAGFAAVTVGPLLAYYAKTYWRHRQWRQEDKKDRGR